MFIHADFANEYIGGGVLCGGCVQEEILFAVAPLHTVTLLLFPRMLFVTLAAAKQIRVIVVVFLPLTTMFVLLIQESTARKLGVRKH